MKGDLERIGWMPSHLTDKELGVAKRSDGNLVAGTDLEAMGWPTP